MDVNFEAGKTEIVAHFTGPDAHRVKREVYRHNEPVLVVNTRCQDNVNVRLVSTYKHLGTIYAVAGRMRAEIRQRIGQAKHEFRRYRKHVYGNPALTMDRRVAIFHSLVMTGLLFDVAIWPRLDKRDFAVFEQGITSLYRALAFAIWGETVFQWRNERVMAKLSVSPADVLLRVARLRYLQHLCLKGDSYVWAFTHLEGGWLKMVHEDLQWLREQIPRRLPQEDPSINWQPWLEDMKMGKRWGNNVRKAQLHYNLQRTKHSDWQEWHRQILQILQTEGLWTDTTIVEHVAMNACLRCRKCFRSDQAWSVHAFRAHQRVTPARKYASGLTCVACLKTFSLHSRLVNHIRYSTRCRTEIARQGISATPEPSVGSRVEAKRHVHRRDIPSIRSQGPLLERQQRMAQYAWDQAEFEFAEDFLDLVEYVIDFEPTVDYGVQRIWEAFQRSIVRPRDLRLLLNRMVGDYERDLEPNDPEDTYIYNYLEELLAEVARLWSGKWLMGPYRTRGLDCNGGS